MIYLVKDEKLLRAWGKLLMGELHTEAVESLKEEGLTLERLELVKKDGNVFAVGTQVGDGQPTNMTRPINIIHRATLLASLHPFKGDEPLGEREVVYEITL